MKKQIDKTISSSTDQVSTFNHKSPIQHQSISKINKHYKEFQHALHTLKVAVEELWHLELEHLSNHESVSSKLSNTKFEPQVPSIYSCRTILPISISETYQRKNETFSNINSPNIAHANPIVSTHKILPNQIDQSNIQSIPHTQKSTETFRSINKQQSESGSGDNSIKYCTKSAILHLKFRCSKHTHINKE
ncbi:unnamed protein product [Adineta steineri]|uniref:Uncharacterized protein n=1 Tax=Adineta steineri TaxID=433720 RepID=A0A814W362_9BILA|nr:unnamed protein product [Adineta steineri]CAF3684403.1 unnamed protein product [Adineta steineri]